MSAEVIETLEESIERFDQGLENTEDSMTTENTCCGYDGSCPEMPEVTIEQITNNIALPGDLTVELSAGTATAKTLTVYLDDDGDVVVGRFEFSIRLVDNPNLSDEVTGAPPMSPGWASAVKHSDPATGLCEVAFEHTGANRDWWIAVSIGGSVSEPIVLNLGV